MADDGSLDGYVRFDFTDPPGRRTRPVFRRGAVPAVIVIHEMPGLHPLVARFADRVASAGMTVFCSSLFGQPGRTVTAGSALGTMLKAICIRREFHVWSTDRSSPIVDWFAGARRLRPRRVRWPGRGGGRDVLLALAMMTEPAMLAPVLSQPSLPLTAGSRRRACAVDASPAEIACAERRFEEEDLSMIGLRFLGDPFVPDARFASLKSTFGARFEAIEIEPKFARPDPRMAPHSVLTLHLDDRDPAGPTKRAEERVIAFFKQRTAA